MNEYVNPFIGVDGAGNCLCGPYLPLSLVRLGPDTLPPHRTNGYRTDSPICRFSHTHVSGTGGGGRYGNIGVFPFHGLARTQLEGAERKNERASAGFYGVTLEPSEIEVELTSTPRTGVHRYRYPAGSEAQLLFDLGWVVQVRVPVGETQAISIGGFIEFISDTELVGRGDYRGGWGHNFPYSVYFYAKVDKPILQKHIWSVQAQHSGSENLVLHYVFSVNMHAH